MKHGMSTLELKAGERVKDVRVTDDSNSVDLFDGRTITVPLPGILGATRYAGGAGELAHCRVPLLLVEEQKRQREEATDLGVS